MKAQNISWNCTGAAFLVAVGETYLGTPMALLVGTGALVFLALVVIVTGGVLRGVLILGAAIGIPALLLEVEQRRAMNAIVMEAREERRQAAEEIAAKQAREERETLEASTQAALEGRTLAEIEGTHGKALGLDRSTGWGQWEKFEARFEGGVVIEVKLR